MGRAALQLTVGGQAIARIVSTYADIAPGEIGALFGSTDHLECAAHAASAGRAARRWRVGGSGGVEAYMMDFDLSEEHTLLEQTVRDWGAREVAPRIRELDRAHKFDRGILPQMAALGLLGVSVPAEYGGAGMDYLSLGVVSEELEYVDTSLRVIMSVHAGLNCLTLLSWGTEDQKQRYLVPQAQGKKIATYGLTEPSAGSDARGIQTVAIKKGDRYLLSGEKMWISLADVADNFLVFAWSDLEKKKKRDPSGLSAFIVERGVQGILERNADREVGHPRGQHRLLQDGRGRGAGREPRRPRGRGIQDRDVRARPGPLHGRGRRDGPDSRVPGREREVRARAAHLRRRDRPAPAREGNDRADGVRLSVGPAAVAAIGLAQEPAAAGTRARPGWRSGSRPSRPSAPPATPCRFTAPTATRTSIRSAASTATARAR